MDKFTAMTSAEYQELNQPKKANKYKNEPVMIDGKKFPSKREANRYGVLKIAQMAGEISNLRLQVTYRLEVNGILVCKYIADFVYDRAGKEIVEDSKGARTKEFVIKKKLMGAVHGIMVKEV